MARNTAQFSEGHGKLAEVPGKLKELAASTGLSESVLSRIRNGATPSEVAAVTLEEKLGIPRDAWRVGAGLGDGPEVTEGEAESGGDDASPRAHLRIARRWREELQRKKAPARDVTAALEAERRAVELVRKSSEEDAEETIGRMIAILRGFPEANEAVAAALEGRL